MAENLSSPSTTTPSSSSQTTPRWLQAIEAWWKLFISLKLMIILLLGIAAACIVGMFFDQTLAYDDHVRNWGNTPLKLWILTVLELNDVFHSWWFGVLVLLFGLNLAACSFERLPKIWIDILNPQRHLSDIQIRATKLKFTTQVEEHHLEKSIQDVAMSWRTSVPKLTTRREGDFVYAFYERHRYARTGVYIIHIALLTMMAGSIATTQWGVDGLMMIPEGKSLSETRVYGPGRQPYSHQLGFEVMCTDFRLKTFVDGSPMDFESDLEIWDPEAAQNPVIKKTIQVNEPLTYKGYTFYQASYRPLPSDQGLTLEIGPRGKESQIYSTVVGSSIKLSDDTTITPLELMTDYAGLGMAVRLRETPPGQDSQTYVVFRSYPDFDRDVRRGKWDIRFRGFDQQFATGVQVGRVPFVEIVFWSAIAMAWGMAMAFFMSHRRYWARWQRQPNGTYTLTMAGAARRHQHQFYMEFKRAQTDVLKNYPLPSGGPYDSTSA